MQPSLLSESALSDLFESLSNHKVPMDIPAQHEIRGTLTSALIMIYKHEQKIEQYKRSFHILSNLIQELIAVNEKKTKILKENGLYIPDDKENIYATL